MEEGHKREGGGGGSEGMKGVWKYVKFQIALEMLTNCCYVFLLHLPFNFQAKQQSASLDVTVSSGPLIHQAYGKALVQSSSMKSQHCWTHDS